MSKRTLASIKFYWVFSWFYNGSPLPLGLIGFLFVLFAELEVESKSKVSLTLCNNTFFYFIEFATVLSKETFLVSEHFCLFFKYILSQYTPSLGHMEKCLYYAESNSWRSISTCPRQLKHTQVGFHAHPSSGTLLHWSEVLPQNPKDYPPIRTEDTTCWKPYRVPLFCAALLTRSQQARPKQNGVIRAKCYTTKLIFQGNRLIPNNSFSPLTKGVPFLLIAK